MDIGIRTNDMPMNINVLAGSLMTFGLLASQVCAYAQTSNSEESSYLIFHDTQQLTDNRPVDSTSVLDRHKNGSPGFNAKQLILPGALVAVGTFGVYNGAFRKLDQNIKNRMDDLRGNHFFRADDYIQIGRAHV